MGPVSTLVTVPAPRLLLVPVAGLLLAAAGCGGGADLDLATVQREILVRTEATYGTDGEVGAVTCPERVEQAEGNDFVCTIEVEGEELAVRVQQLDDDETVRLSKLQSVIPTSDAVEYVTSFGARTGRPVREVSCGRKTLLVRAPGERIVCEVEFADGTREVARLQVADTDGKIGMQGFSPQ
jgi:hypothetical protein